MLSAQNLTKQYGSFTALHPLDLTVNPGDIYCLLGANGAGKTTTINLFLGFIAPTSGQAFINGLDVQENLIQTKKSIAYIPENLMLYPTLTGLENLRYFAELADKKYNLSQLSAFLEEAGLQTEAFHKRARTYSKGMRLKVGIAIALAKDARALLLDEPTSGLSPQASNEFSALLLQMKQKGIATLMATQDLFQAKQVGTHIGIMQQGTLRKSFEANQISLPELEQAYLEIIQQTNL